MTTKVRAGRGAANAAHCKRCGKPRWSGKSELCPACFKANQGSIRNTEVPATKDLWSASPSPEEDVLPAIVADRPDHMSHLGQLSPEQIENRTKVDAEVREHLDFVRQVAACLQETSQDTFYQIHLLVRILKKDRVMSLLKETLVIEQSGGMMTVDGTQRRTPGGVFFRLIKQQYGKENPMVRQAAWKVQNEKVAPLPIASTTHLAQS